MRVDTGSSESPPTFICKTLSVTKNDNLEMNSDPSISKDKFKPDGTTDWSSKGLVLWLSFIENSLWQIENIKSRRFTLGQRESITITVIINLAASVEAFTKEMLYDYLTSEPEIIKSNSNIRNYLLASVENQSFDKLVAFFPTITGKKFSDVISCSKDITILMDFRSRLVHGQIPTLTFNKVTKEIIYSNSYKNICEYIYDKIDVPIVHSGSGYHIEFLSFKVIGHFLNIVIEYMRNYKNIFTVKYVQENIEKQLGEIIEKINKLNIPDK